MHMSSATKVKRVEGERILQASKDNSCKHPLPAGAPLPPPTSLAAVQNQSVLPPENQTNPVAVHAGGNSNASAAVEAPVREQTREEKMKGYTDRYFDLILVSDPSPGELLELHGLQMKLKKGEGDIDSDRKDIRQVLPLINALEATKGCQQRAWAATEALRQANEWRLAEIAKINEQNKLKVVEKLAADAEVNHASELYRELHALTEKNPLAVAYVRDRQAH
jgi:hypothetical protein